MMKETAYTGQVSVPTRTNYTGTGQPVFMVKTTHCQKAGEKVTTPSLIVSDVTPTKTDPGSIADNCAIRPGLVCLQEYSNLTSIESHNGMSQGTDNQYLWSSELKEPRPSTQSQDKAKQHIYLWSTDVKVS